MPHRTLNLRAGLIVTAIALCGLIVVPIAGAATTGASCGYKTFKQPFLPWGDSGTYVPTQNGSFESGTGGWSLSGGAKTTGPGTTLISGTAKYGLYLPVGSSATSPPICVETGFPYARMFAYTPTPTTVASATLRVDVLYTDAVYNKTVTEPAAVVTQTAGWAPTGFLTLPAVENIKPDKTGKLWVTYSFTPLYRTAWKIDDFYVDPKRR